MKKEKKSSKDQLIALSSKTLGFVARYRVTIMIVLFGAVVGLSLYRSSTYSNIPRNETKFEEINSQSKVIKIDVNLIERIKESVDEENPSIGENTSPGRTNPFSE